MNATQLKNIAEEAMEERLNTIISALKEQALYGKNYLILEDLPEILASCLNEKGYTIVAFYKTKRSFFFKKTKKKYYKVKF